MPKLYLVGIGPGSTELIAPMAVRALENSDIIMGYEKYTELIEKLVRSRSIESGPVTGELERAKKAIEYVLEGKTVAIISSGDSGIYGMAGIVIEFIAAHHYDIDIQIVPGITALNSAGSLLGVPFMNDFCSISLSDRLTEKKDIKKRIQARNQAKERILEKLAVYFRCYRSYSNSCYCGISNNKSILCSSCKYFP